VSWPLAPAERDRFVLGHRPERPAHDPWRSQGVIVEEEVGPDGRAETVATVFLTGRECPWRCTMCDLWRYTTADDTPLGAIPAQIADARRTLDGHPAHPTVIKLYNAGSFFDPRAVPESDYNTIAELLAPFARVIVECHPSLVGVRVERFIAALERAQPGGRPSLEVAMGLETAHPHALESLNKRMDLASFSRAAEYLATRDIPLRVFLLIAPPFVPADEQDEWLIRSIDAALACGATAVALIPTRVGNGAMEVLAQDGRFTPPSREMTERSIALARAHVGTRARVFLDPWSQP
jgi:radical SAM enzyme (TIGR01210 family)